MEKVKIIKKEYIGKRDVYDIEVKDHHHYILKDGIISHNSGLKYFASTIILLTKGKVKDDKTKSVTGVLLKAKTIKNRFAKEEKTVKIYLDFINGLNPYYGLQGEQKSNKAACLTNYCLPILEKKSISGTKWIYNGEIIDHSELFGPEQEKYWTDDLLAHAREAMIKDITYGNQSSTVIPLEEGCDEQED